MTEYYDASAWTGRTANVKLIVNLFGPRLRKLRSPGCFRVMYLRRPFDIKEGEACEAYGFSAGVDWATGNIGLRLHWKYWDKFYLWVSMRRLVEMNWI